MTIEISAPALKGSAMEKFIGILFQGHVENDIMFEDIDSNGLYLV